MKSLAVKVPLLVNRRLFLLLWDLKLVLMVLVYTAPFIFIYSCCVRYVYLLLADSVLTVLASPVRGTDPPPRLPLAVVSAQSPT